MGRFERDGHALNVRVEGRLVFKSIRQIHAAAFGGSGMAHMPEDIVLADIAASRLKRLPAD